jgi:ribonuclease Z
MLPADHEYTFPLSLKACALCLVLLISLAGPTGILAAGIKVTLLGTGNPIPSIERFGPSTLVEAGKERLLFDCGRGASQRLWQRGIPLSAISMLFLTHLHSDHIVGILDLWLTGWLPTPFGRRSDPFRIKGPTGTNEMMSHLQMAYRVDINFRNKDEKLPLRGVEVLAEDITEGEVYQQNGVKVTAFSVDHGAMLKPALGYRIDYEGRSIIISGDTRPSENLVRFAAHADLVVHEVAMAQEDLLAESEAARRIIAHHTTPDQAGRLFSRIAPRLAVYSHIVLLTTEPAIPPPTIAQLIAATRKTYSGPLEVGEDLMSIEIGTTLEVHRF